MVKWEGNMEEKKINIEEKKTLDGIMNKVNIVLLVLFFTIGKSSNPSTANIVLYITASLLIIVNLFINPLIEFKKGCSKVNNKLISRETKLGIKITMGIIILFILNKLVFSKSIVTERLYWLYSLMAIFIIISVAARFILICVNNAVVLVEDKLGATKHKRKPLAIEVFLFLIIFIMAIQCYEPKRVVSFSNMKLPSGLLAIDYMNQGTSNSSSRRCVDITDLKFIEDFQKEISKARAENVRNLDRANYEIRKVRGISYYSIRLLYKDLNGGSLYSNNINEGYIQEIRVHKNGEVLILCFPILHSNFNKIQEIYRLNLPEEYKNEIIKTIELGL